MPSTLINETDVITVAFLGVPRNIKIKDVKVTIDVDYPHPGDLNVFLYSPEQAAAKAPGATRWRQRHFAANRLRCGPEQVQRTRPAAPGGAYRGNEPLANYRDQNAAGVWSLAASNNGSNDYIGWILGYSLTIMGEV